MRCGIGIWPMGWRKTQIIERNQRDYFQDHDQGELVTQSQMLCDVSRQAASIPG
jgi:hypothetical protein